MILAGRYELLRQLGRGGMAQVWEARDTVLGRTVAVKVVALDSLEPTTADRFRREAVATAALNHPSIVTVHDAGTDGTTAYLVMELVRGQDLGRTLRERGALPLGDALRIGGQVADALAVAHTHGIVHRDIKPANVIVDGDRVVVVDFGIARLTEAVQTALTAPGSTIGTAEYMSPEQARAEAATPAADVYSLGCLLVALVTGAPPFTGEHPLAVLQHHVATEPRALSTGRADVPAELDRLVGAMLAKHPAERPAAAVVRDALARLGAAGPPTLVLPGTGTTVPVPEPAGPPTAVLSDPSAASRGEGRPARRSRTPLVVAAGLAVLAAIAAGLLLADRPPGPEDQSLSGATTSPEGETGARDPLAGLRSTIESLALDGSEEESTRDELLKRWEELGEAAEETDKPQQAAREAREFERQVDELVEKGDLGPQEARALDEAVAAVVAALPDAPAPEDD